MSVKTEIVINDELHVTDSVSATGWCTPIFFKKEYEKYRDGYLSTDKEDDLIMAYILMQIYLENHFHYYLRFMIGGAICRPIEGWDEWKHADKKLELLRDFLSTTSVDFKKDDFASIVSYFREITMIRNMFVHGHPISHSHSNDGVSVSEAKTLLNRQAFSDMRQKANRLTFQWNALITSLQAQNSLLIKNGRPVGQVLESCKFDVL